MSILDLFRLDDKVAVITGASSGLGVAFAQAFAEAGADVALGARRVDRLQDTKRLVEGLGRRAVTVGTDVSDPEACSALVAAAMEEFGRVDILINNAGVGTAIPALKETPDQFRQVLDINLHGSYWMAQAAGRVMQPGSSIVNLSSVLGFKTEGLPQAAYSSSKAAIAGLTRDLAQQWGQRKGIRVNALAPGWFTSEMTDGLQDGFLDAIAAKIPAKRIGDPPELATAAIWLASPAGSYMTGQTVFVDGGLSIV